MITSVHTKRRLLTHISVDGCQRVNTSYIPPVPGHGTRDPPQTPDRPPSPDQENDDNKYFSKAGCRK
jgi:hypothetical protein